MHHPICMWACSLFNNQLIFRITGIAILRSMKETSYTQSCTQSCIAHEYSSLCPPLLYTHYCWLYGIWSDWWMEWSSVSSLDTSHCCWSSVHFVVLCCVLTPQDGATPLWFASCHGRTEVARLLIDHGAKVNQQSTVCFDNNCNSLCTPFQSLSIHIQEKNGNYPLTDACANGHLDTVKLLIDRGAKVNAQTKVSHK